MGVYDELVEVPGVDGCVVKVAWPAVLNQRFVFAPRQPHHNATQNSGRSDTQMSVKCGRGRAVLLMLLPSFAFLLLEAERGGR